MSSQSPPGLSIDDILEALPAEMSGLVDDTISSAAYQRRLYLQSLYRFFRLSDFRSDFRDPFGLFICSFPSSCRKWKTLPSLARMLYKRKFYYELQNLFDWTHPSYWDEFSDSDQIDMYMMDGRVSIWRHAIEGACARYEKGVRRFPDNEPLRYAYVKTLLAARQYELASREVGPLLLAYPDDLRYQYLSAMSLMAEKKAADALPSLFRLNYEHPDDPETAAALAWALLMTGQAEKAEQQFRRLTATPQSRAADAATIETGTSHWVPELIGSMISTTLIGISLFFFDWRMALAAVWVIPIAISIVLFSSKFQNRFNRRSVQAKVELADSIQEGLEAFQDIRANDAESKYLQELWPSIDLVEKRAIQAELGVAIFVVSGQMVLKLGIATIALVGALLLSAGSLDVLTFFMFLLVASRLYDPMSGSLINLGAVVSLGVQSERMDEILNHEEQGGKETLTNKGYDIEFKEVRFAYDTSETVLDGVSFTAKQGEVTALIGPSGSGKTTISRLASRFWDIPSGTITVGGMDISKIDPETLMSLYSIVFQDVTLFNNTVLENIRIGRKDASDEEVIAAARLAHVDVFAEKLPQGWNTMIGENGSELSGGERQRISIARAFLKDAPIILMDEATASLDVENETFIQESLSRLVKDKTVIIIAHRMRTVAGADKIVVLKEGKVEECGTPAELTASGGFYKRMQDIQQGALEWNI